MVCAPVEALWTRAIHRIFSAIGTKGRAGRSTVELLGCEKEAFFNHIDIQFSLPGNEGMSWARIGEIDIDHRIPIGFGNPTLEQKIARLHYLNCQPMWRHENKAKGLKFIGRPNEELYELPKATPELPQAAPEQHISDDELFELLGFAF